MKNEFTSYEVSKQLWESGLMIALNEDWHSVILKDNSTLNIKVTADDVEKYEWFPCYSLAELMEEILKQKRVQFEKDHKEELFYAIDEDGNTFAGSSIVDAAGDVLIKILES